MLMAVVCRPVMTVQMTSTLMSCLQRAALGKQRSASPGLAGRESERVMQQLRGIAAQYSTHGNLRCARSVWHGEAASNGQQSSNRGNGEAALDSAISA